MKRLLTIMMLLTSLLMPAGLLVGSAGAVNIVPNCAHPNDRASNTDTPDICQDITTQQGSSDNPIITIIKTAITIISYVIGGLAVIFILVSSIRMITSGGDAQAAASGRRGMIYSLVGIMVAIMAQVIVVFVLDKVK